MRTRSFTIASTLSLLLSLTVGVLWVRSHSVADFISHRTVHRERPGFKELGVESLWGSIHMTYLDTPGSLPPAEATGLVYGSGPFQRLGVPRDTAARRWGFGYYDRSDASSPSPVRYVYRTVWLPHWVAALATAILPVACFASRARAGRIRRRIKRGVCVHCGYDLRASSDRCPECGTPVPTMTAITDSKGP